MTENRIRLLYLINGLGPGGAERSLAGLLPHFLAADVEPVVVCLGERTSGVRTAIERLGCQVRLLEARSFHRKVRQVRRWVAGGAFDLVHTTLFESDVLGRVAAARTGVPVLGSLVNTSYEPIRLDDPNVSGYGLRAARTIDGWTARHLGSAFHAITHAVKDSAVRRLGIPPDRIEVVERGRSRDDLGHPGGERRRRARHRLGIGWDVPVILNVARQEYQKGQSCLLEAAALLRRERPDLVVLIAGRPGHATPELLERCDRLRLGDAVRFLGDRDDVPELLSAADVFAFPSTYEGLGGAVIEAMAMGLPVVASDIPVMREVLEEGGNALLFPRGSPADLSSALLRVLEDPDLARSFGERSVEIFSERFTLEKSAAGMIDLYRRVAAGGRPTPPAVPVLR